MPPLEDSGHLWDCCRSSRCQAEGEKRFRGGHGGSEEEPSYGLRAYLKHAW